MARIIALDPSSTVTGWAVFQEDGLVAWGKIDTSKLQFAERLSLIVGEISRRAAQYGARDVAIEDVKFAWHGKNRNRNIMGLQAVFRSVKDWAAGMKYPFTPYNPATWKNAIVGHVNASKETTKENLCLRFPTLPRDLTDHEYDAIAIGLYHCSMKRFGNS
jgi:Holliday junction resolvasome RuvABC endonuclease subunit